MKKKRNKATKRSRTKRILLWSSLVIIVGLGILTAVRWRAWFGNVPEAPYTAPLGIDRITLTPGAYFASDRTISWRSGDKLQDSWLEYRIPSRDSLAWHQIPATGRLIETRAGRACYYTASLHGLAEGEHIYYRVQTGAKVSPEQSFSMPTGLEQMTSFVYLGDVQDPNGSVSDGCFAILRDSVIAQRRVDFIAGAGDQIEGPTDAYWQIWYTALGDSLPSSMPMIFSTGNHEYLKRGFMRELDPRWTAQYNYPTNGPEDFEGRSYYIDFPLLRFIVLDTTDINDPMAIIRHRSWLMSTLRSSAQPWQVVMFHHAVHSVRAGRSNLVMSTIFGPILEEYGADLVLQGHDHAYSRIACRSEEGKLQTPLYAISTSSPKVYRNGFDPIHDRLGSGMQLYQLIDLTPERLDYRSYQYSGELYDHVAITRAGDGLAPQPITDLARDIPELFLFDAFGSSSKGLKKAARYREEAEKWLQRSR